MQPRLRKINVLCTNISLYLGSSTCCLNKYLPWHNLAHETSNTSCLQMHSVFNMMFVHESQTQAFIFYIVYIVAALEVCTACTADDFHINLKNGNNISLFPLHTTGSVSPQICSLLLCSARFVDDHICRIA